MGCGLFSAGGFESLIIVALSGEMQNAVEKTGVFSIFAGTIAL